jgi:hypothetical protein
MRSKDADGDESKESAEDSVYDNPFETLDELAKRCRYHALPVCFYVDDDLSYDAVERQIAEVIRVDPGGKRRPKFDPFRNPPRTKRFMEQVSPAPIDTITALSSDTWSSLLKSAWRGIAPLTTSSVVPYYSGTEVGTVVHLIGSPVQSSSGLYLDIGAASTYMGTTAQSAMSENVSRSDNLLAADAFAQANTCLCIVQAAPLPDADALVSEVHREQVADLRRFAAELLEAGTHTVLVIPGLPAGPASVALRRFAQQLGRKVPVPFPRLIEAVSQLRQFIRDEFEQMEWEVTLYTPAPWRSSLIDDLREKEE